jgi:hypothetical protein
MSNKISFGGIEHDKYANHLYDKIFIEPNGNQPKELRIANPYKILYVGKSFQESLLKPYIDKLLLINKTLKIEIVTVIHKNDDKSTPVADGPILSNKNFDKVKHKNLKFTPNLGEEIFIQFSNPEILLNKNDPYKESLSKRSFDIIFCFFEHHFLINWRIGALSIFEYLKDGGAFIFGETSGTFDMLDGNFKNLPSEAISSINTKPLKDTDSLHQLYDELMKFDVERSKYHFWKPEISVSNYKEMRYQMARVFNHIYEKDKVKNRLEKNQNDGYFINETKLQLDKDALIEWIKGGKLSYFRQGISLNINETKDKEKIYSLIESLCNNINELQYSFTIHLQVYVAKGYNLEWAKGYTARKWNFSPLIKDLQQINDNNWERLGKKALDVMASHDILLPEHSNYLALVEWCDTKDLGWGFPIHILNNINNRRARYSAESDDVICNIWRWIQIEKSEHFAVLQTFFLNSDHKPIIRIRTIKNFNFQKEKYQEQYIDENLTIYFKLHNDRKGIIEEIDIYFDYVVDNKNDSYSIEIMGKRKNEILEKLSAKNPLERTSLSSEIPYKTNTIRNGNIEYIAILDGFFKPDDNYFNYIKDSYEPEPKSELQKEVKVALKAFKSVFKTIYYTHFKTDKKNDHELTFFPSALIESKFTEGQKKISIDGLGGAILFEKSIEDKGNINELYKARNRALVDAVNLIYYKASILNYNSIDVRRNARKAAVAVINARNSSHIIGSHVLPDLINDQESYSLIRELEEMQVYFRRPDIKITKNLYAKINTIANKSRDYQQFLDYQMKRSEYIAQLTTDFPSWSVSTWFVKGLMAEFYKQYNLLNSIVSSEGIRAFNYDRPNEKGKLEIKLFLRKWIDVNNVSEPYLISNRLQGCIDLLNVKNKLPEEGKFFGICLKIVNKIYVLVRIKNDQIEKSTNFENENIKLYELKWKDVNVLQSIKSGDRIIFNGSSENSSDLEIINCVIEEKSQIVDLLSTKFESDDILKFIEDLRIQSKLPIFSEDLQINIPGGITGNHAFFIILENIIRNAAKHDWHKINKDCRENMNLEVNIELEGRKDKDNKDIYICKVWTNTSNLLKDSKIIGDQKETHTLEKSIHQQINDYIGADVLESPSLEHKKEHLGISEIKINAAHLCGLDLFDENTLCDKDFIILKDKSEYLKGYLKASHIWDVVVIKDKSTQSSEVLQDTYDRRGLVPRLGYRFLLQKPKEFSIISNDHKNGELLNQHNVVFVSHEEMEKSIKTSTSIDYEFCIIIDDHGYNNPNDSCFCVLIKKLIGLFESKERQNLIAKKEIEMIYSKIESLPYRLLFVEKDIFSENSVLSLLKKLKNSSETVDKNKKLCADFILKRIQFLDIMIFEDQNKHNILNLNDGNNDSKKIIEAFKIKIYDKWLEKYGIKEVKPQKTDISNDASNLSQIGENKMYFFALNIEDKMIKEMDYISSSVPHIYRNIQTLKSEAFPMLTKPPYEKDLKVNENTSTIVKYNINYKRHDSSVKYLTDTSNNIYTESLTGSKTSYHLIKQLLSTQDGYLREKLTCFLYENAMSVVMVIDERVNEYYKDNVFRKDLYAYNIIVP